MKRIFVDMDGTVTEYKPFISIDQFYQKNYFLDLYPHYNVINALKSLSKDKEIYILSKVVDSPYAIDEKNRWLDKYMPFIDKNHRIFVKYNELKTAHIPDGIHFDDILLDDFNDNLLEWNHVGGIGVKLINDVNSPESYHGEKIDKELPEILIFDILNNL